MQGKRKWEKRRSAAPSQEEQNCPLAAVSSHPELMRDSSARQHWGFSTAPVLRGPDRLLTEGLAPAYFIAHSCAASTLFPVIHDDLSIAPCEVFSAIAEDLRPNCAAPVRPETLIDPREGSLSSCLSVDRSARLNRPMNHIYGEQHATKHNYLLYQYI